MRYKLGIIGYGGFGQFLHHAWKKLDHVEIVAIADQLASRNPGGNIQFFDRWRELINDEQVDIVSIATPPSSHAEIACAAMEAGKHIILEKPIAITVEDAERIIATRNRTGVKATVDYMMRFNPIMEALGKLSQEKVLGELRRVDVENYAQDSSLPDDHWFWDHHISGGILIEHGVHFIDLVHSLTDEKFVKVTGFHASHHRNLPNQVMANVLYDKGLMATHYHAFTRPGFFEDTTIRLNYDIAQIDTQGWIPLKGQIRALVNSDSVERLKELPNLIIQLEKRIAEIEDVSRPEGWGSHYGQSADMLLTKVRSGGIEYDVEKMIIGTFDIGRPKSEVYSDCLCAILTDLINAIENPDHSLRVSLEDGLLSLKIAVLASQI